MKNVFLVALMPIIVTLFVIGLVHYFLTKNDTGLETWNDIFEFFWS